jgi:hypothetical protein
VGSKSHSHTNRAGRHDDNGSERSELSHDLSPQTCKKLPLWGLLRQSSAPILAKYLWKVVELQHGPANIRTAGGDQTPQL